MPSLFTTEFDRTIDRWAALLPPHLRAAFRHEFHAFTTRYDAALDTLEGIWERRERAYAFDEPTGLATRGSFHDYLITLLNETPSPSLNAVAVLFIDLDDLKRINDTSGHQMGDCAIAAVGAIVREALREGHDDRVVRVVDDAFEVGRHGGDEFVAALPLTDASEIEHVALRVKQRADDRARQQRHGYGGPIELTISVGSIVYALTEEPPPIALNSLATALLAAADGLMYESKRDGSIHVARARFTDRLETFAERRLLLTAVSPGA